MKHLQRFGRYLEIYWHAKREKDSAEFRFNCPNCHDTKQHFSFNIEFGVSNCFRCGYRPSPLEFLQEKGHLDFDEISELLEKEDIVEETIPLSVSVELPKGFCPVDSLPEFWNEVLKQWTSTNVILFEDMKKLGCGIVVQKPSRYYGRLIIPVYEDGKLVTFLARVLLDGVEPKYLFPSLPRKDAIWGLENINSDVVKQEKEIIICEGWQDSYKIHGFALLGKSMSVNQMEKILSRVPSDYVIGVMLDKDAWKNGYEVASQFRIRCGVVRRIKLYNIFGRKDPGECFDREDAILNSYRYDFNRFLDRIKARTQSVSILR